jgi:hypothetical protein
LETQPRRIFEMFTTRNEHMTNTTTSNDKNKLNFKDWMNPERGDSLDRFFDGLSDSGLPIASTADEFLDNEEMALCDADQLSCELLFYGKWFESKLYAFNQLNEIGFEGVKAQSDHAEIISVKQESRDGYFDGEWCRQHGVIYVSLDGVVQAASACERGAKRERHADDLKTAHYLLRNLHESSIDQSEAA